MLSGYTLTSQGISNDFEIELVDDDEEIAGPFRVRYGKVLKEMILLLSVAASSN